MPSTPYPHDYGPNNKQPGQWQPPAMSAIESSKPVESLRKQLEEATMLCSRALIPQDAYRRWRCTTEELIIRAFGPESRSVAAFRRDGELLVGSAAWEMNEGLLAVQRRRDLADEIAVLMGCIAQLDSSSVDGRRTQPGEDDRRSIL